LLNKRYQKQSLTQLFANIKGLYDTIANLDAAFFNAFNTPNLDKLKALFSENLEFYHDVGA